MSYDVQAWASRCRTGNGTLKSVLLTLANFADEDGLCWPSQERLAFDTELTDRTIRAALAKLEEAGFIVRKARYAKDGTRKTDFIFLQIHRKDLPVADPPTGKRRRDLAEATGISRHEPPESRSGKLPIEPPDSRADARECARKARSSPQTILVKTVKVDRRKPKTRIPSDFTLTTLRFNMGLARGLAEERVRHEFERFVNSALAHDRRYADWDRALDNWFVGEASGKFGPRAAALGTDRRGSGSYIDATVRVAARFAAQRVSREQGDGREDPLPF